MAYKTTHRLNAWQIAAIEAALKYAIHDGRVDALSGSALKKLFETDCTVTVAVYNIDAED